MISEANPDGTRVSASASSVADQEKKNPTTTLARICAAVGRKPLASARSAESYRGEMRKPAV